MTSKLGPYWSVMHRRPQDYAFFKQLQSSVFKIMDGGPPDYQFARDELPNSLVIARDHALSEQHSDMLKDPVGTGQRHAHEWDGHQKRLGFDRAKSLILGINEPHIWEPGVPEALRLYTIALCDEATTLDLRVGAMQLSVGWPNNDGPDTPPNWSQWHGVDNAIRHNNGALIVHEYWADQGPSENWGWWAGRVLKCPWQVPIIIGETGIDMYVKDASVAHLSRGWRGRKSPEQYAQELADYVGRMSADSRFVGCAVFAADFANGEWASFDIEPAYQAILATPIPNVTPTPQPPTPAPDGPTAVVMALRGANVRSGPGTEYTVKGAEALGTVMPIVGKNGGWYLVELPHVKGWVSNTVVEAFNVDDVPVVDAPPVKPTQPTTTPTGDCWERALAFVLRWEGLWADDPNDSGGATMKGITLGTYTRWRDAQGKLAPTKDDLRNITDAEVRQIYHDWYWLASGSNQLPFPLCLAHFNIAVNAGPARAEQFLNESGGNFKRYVAAAMDWYTRIDGWKHYGAAWTRRNADVLREAAKVSA